MSFLLNNKKIELNNMTDINCNIEEMDLTKLSKPELLAKCEELGINKCKSKNKGELIEHINQKQTTTQTIPLKKIEFIIEDKDDETDILIDTTPINDNIKILNADCMIELNKLQDNSIDCVITDPPYFIDKLDNNWSSTEVNSDVKNSHITHLPKGMKFDKSQVKNLYDYYLIKLVNRETPIDKILIYEAPPMPDQNGKINYILAESCIDCNTCKDCKIDDCSFFKNPPTGNYYTTIKNLNEESTIPDILVEQGILFIDLCPLPLPMTTDIRKKWGEKLVDMDNKPLSVVLLELALKFALEKGLIISEKP